MSEIPGTNDDHSKDSSTVLAPTEPVVFFKPEARRFRDEIRVDVELIQGELLESGFPEHVANTFAVVFHDQPNRRLRQQLPGWHSPGQGLTLKKNTGERVHFPNAIHINLPAKSSHINNYVWHEFGHVDELVSGIERTKLYNNDKVISRTRKTAIGTAATGVVIYGLDHMYNLINFRTGNTSVDAALDLGVTSLYSVVSAAGAYSSFDPGMPLWLADPSERHARKFARQRRKLRPVTAR